MERMIYGDLQSFKKIADIPLVFFYYMRRMLKKRFWEQGIARHTKEEVTDIMTKNLKAVSIILGNKQYFGGDVICEEDCGIFGVLAQCLWGLPDSTYETMMNGTTKTKTKSLDYTIHSGFVNGWFGFFIFQVNVPIWKSTAWESGRSFGRIGISVWLND